MKTGSPTGTVNLLEAEAPLPLWGGFPHKERVRKRLSQGEERRGERQRDVRELFQRMKERKWVREKTDK